MRRTVKQKGLAGEKKDWREDRAKGEEPKASEKERTNKQLKRETGTSPLQKI